jgi:hypothetical protein
MIEEVVSRRGESESAPGGIGIGQGSAGNQEGRIQMACTGGLRILALLGCCVGFQWDGAKYDLSILLYLNCRCD